jgi:hypothetical protein
LKGAVRSSSETTFSRVNGRERVGSSESSALAS